jgi:hypothetical protein
VRLADDKEGVYEDPYENFTEVEIDIYRIAILVKLKIVPIEVAGSIPTGWIGSHYQVDTFQVLTAMNGLELRK